MVTGRIKPFTLHVWSHEAETLFLRCPVDYRNCRESPIIDDVQTCSFVHVELCVSFTRNIISTRMIFAAQSVIIVAYLCIIVVRSAGPRLETSRVNCVSMGTCTVWHDYVIKVFTLFELLAQFWPSSCQPPAGHFQVTSNSKPTENHLKTPQN